MLFSFKIGIGVLALFGALAMIWVIGGLGFLGI